MDNTLPFFSIVVPVLNMGSFLHDCLDSITNQSLTNWECICIDDGSTDNSWEILSAYAAKDSRFKCFRQKNAGVSVARNVGMDKSGGYSLPLLIAMTSC